MIPSSETRDIKMLPLDDENERFYKVLPLETVETNYNCSDGVARHSLIEDSVSTAPVREDNFRNNELTNTEGKPTMITIETQ